MDEITHVSQPITPSSLEDLLRLVGKALGPTNWHRITQKRIDDFAAATEDFQWIHGDVDRATAGPLGTTIAHGLFTLSLGPKFTMELISFDGFNRSINYGYNRVRFPAPVPSGAGLRMRATVTEVAEIEGGAQVTLEQTFECEGVEKPVCVGESLSRFYEQEAGS